MTATQTAIIFINPRGIDHFHRVLPCGSITATPDVTMAALYANDALALAAISASAYLSSIAPSLIGLVDVQSAEKD